ncbi:hypothetical protein X739_17135 [Mesorhizobium sp. LNHC220B00]|nr:hypothetical protein X739_17135 [Mesorhizobium sp. LNHC220B00]
MGKLGMLGSATVSIQHTPLWHSSCNAILSWEKTEWLYPISCSTKT